MGRIEKTVFISYRRTNVSWALAIFQDLQRHGYDVFLDYTGIASGDFERVILENISARAHFLALLTPSALERAGDPTDWLRREIEAALDSHRNIVPLLLEGFDFNTPAIAGQLTGKLAELKRYNALSVPPAYFPEAMARLRERYLAVALDAVPHPISPSARSGAAIQKAAAATAPAVRTQELTDQQAMERSFQSYQTLLDPYSAESARAVREGDILLSGWLPPKQLEEHRRKMDQLHADHLSFTRTMPSFGALIHPDGEVRARARAQASRSILHDSQLSAEAKAERLKILLQVFAEVDSGNSV